MEDAVATLLYHFCVRIETRVAQLRDLFGEELDSICRITEDDGLIDLQLGE